MSEFLKTGEQPDPKMAAMVREVADLLEHMSPDEIDELERQVEARREAKREAEPPAEPPLREWEVVVTFEAEAEITHIVLARTAEEAKARFRAGKFEDSSPPELTTTFDKAISIAPPKARDMGKTWMRVFEDEPTDGSPSRGFYVGSQSGPVDECYFATAEEAENHLLAVYLYAGQKP